MKQIKILKSIKEEVVRYWDKNAKIWTCQVRKRKDVYREYFNNPAFLRFLGKIKGKKVLDAGCGEGYNTRIFARMGAKVVGIDISKKLIDYATQAEVRNPLGIKYYVSSFTNLKIFENDYFDLVISTMAMMDSPNFDKAVKEIFRILRPGGEFIFSILHPCFITKGFNWIRVGDEDRLTVSHYFDERVRIGEWRFHKASRKVLPFKLPAFYLPLSKILKTLIKNGFILKDIEEPRPEKSSLKKFPEWEKWYKHAALFLYIRCKKETLE